MKTLLRKIISRIPGVRFWVAGRIFLGPQHNAQRMWGVFPTWAKAKAHIPKGMEQKADETMLLLDFEETVPERDLPVVRILTGLMPAVKNVFDLGGNVGSSFYQYRTQIPYPPSLRWTIYDFPFVNETGRKLALQRGETQLVFTDKLEEGNNADVYLTAGALQYLEHAFADVLGKLKDKPRHVMVNRVPMTEGRPFYTLQHTGYAVVTYYIANHDEFISSIEALGYKLQQEWKNDRACDVILRPDHFVRHYYGFYFERK